MTREIQSLNRCLERCTDQHVRTKLENRLTYLQNQELMQEQERNKTYGWLSNTGETSNAEGP